MIHFVNGPQLICLPGGTAMPLVAWAEEDYRWYPCAYIRGKLTSITNPDAYVMNPL